MPAERYWESEGVSPARAKSKSLVARARASGGRSEIGVGFEGGGWEDCGCDCGGGVAWGRPILCDWLVVGGCLGVSMIVLVF